MSNNIVPIGQAKAPSTMRARLQAAGGNKNFASGVRDSFPILSIKGKVFRIRVNGEEKPLIDQQTNQVIPFLDVVLVDASPNLSKTYYARGFEEGEATPPDCWSLDSIKPDPSVPEKMNPTCPDCPMNVFGSAPSRDGTKRGGKACQDARRVAVMMPGHLETAEPPVFMLRVPATSLKNLKEYAQLLERQNWMPSGCVTRLSFDYKEAYPKLVFNFVDGLDDGEFEKVEDIAGSSSTRAMLNAPDFDMAASKEPRQEEKTERRVRQQAPLMDVPEEPKQTSAPNQTQTSQQAIKEAQARAAAAMSPEPETMLEPHQDLVELPDGQWYDAATGEFVEAQKAILAVAEETKAEIDPDILVLPDGKFFHRKARKYVVSQYLGAAEVGTEPKKAAAKPRSPRKPKEAVETKAEEAAVQQAIPEDQPEETVAQTTTNGHTGRVQPTPAALDDILRSVFPAK
jgi:hypothetical protein